MLPDYGIKLKSEGYSSQSICHYFYGVPIYGFDSCGQPDKFSSTFKALYGSDFHCLTLDFDQIILENVLRALSTSERQSIKNQLDRESNKFLSFNFSEPIYCEKIGATLGELQSGHNEKFIPLIIREIEIRYP